MRTRVLQQLIDTLKADTYLEIGVNHGATFFAIDAPRKIAVDPSFTKRWHNRSKKKHEHGFELTSDAFFTWHGNVLFRDRKIDVAFVDGLHTFEQSLRDIQHCLMYLSETGVIVVHDCLPPHRAAAAVGHNKRAARSNYQKSHKGGWTGEWTGDVWKSIVFLRVFRPDLEVFVLDADYGLGMISLGAVPSGAQVDGYTLKQIREMTYDFFQVNKRELMNLKEPDHLGDWLRSSRLL